MSYENALPAVRWDREAALRGARTRIINAHNAIVAAVLNEDPTDDLRTALLEAIAARDALESSSASPSPVIERSRTP